jgi:hypothetical protein
MELQLMGFIQLGIKIIQNQISFFNDNAEWLQVDKISTCMVHTLKVKAAWKCGDGLVYPESKEFG